MTPRHRAQPGRPWASSLTRAHLTGSPHYPLSALPRARAVYLIGRELEMTADVALHLRADDAELTRRLQAVH